MDGKTKEFNTRWFYILRARLGEPCEDAVHELQELCLIFNPAVFAFIRRNGRSQSESQKLSSAFVIHMASGNFLRYVKREHERFRYFLLEALKHVLDERWFLDRSEECYGGFGDLYLAGDTLQERTLKLAGISGDLSPEGNFHRTWAIIVLHRAFMRLERSGIENGTRELFEELKPHLTDGLNMISQETSKRLGLSETSLHLVMCRLRNLYGAFVRAEVRETVRSSTLVEAEIRDLAREGQIVCRPAMYA